MPKVSVIVPNYNHALFLPQRLQSIVDQTFRDFEIIILDDASTDDSITLIQDFAKRWPVRLLLNEENTGIPFKQWNRGVREAQGEYIWIAESDDYADPLLLETLVSILDAHRSVGLAYCESWMIDEHGANLGRCCEQHTRCLHPTRWQSDFINNGHQECATYLLQACTLPNASAALFRREVYQQAGGAEEGLRLCGDWMTWARLLLRSELAFTCKPLNYFRFHPQSVRSQVIGSKRNIEEEYTVRAYICQQAHPTSAVRRQTARKAWLRWKETMHVQYLADHKKLDWRWVRRVYHYARVLDRCILFRLALGLLQVQARNSDILGPLYWFAIRVLKGQPRPS